MNLVHHISLITKINHSQLAYIFFLQQFKTITLITCKTVYPMKCFANKGAGAKKTV